MCRRANDDLTQICGQPTSDSNPVDGLARASLLSRLTFGWVYPLLALGRSRPLTEADLPQTPDPERSITLYEALEARWQHELQRSPSAPSFARALLLCLLPTLLPSALIAVLESALLITQAVCLGMLVSILAREDASDAVPEMLGWAAAVSVTSVVAVFCHQHFFFASFRHGLRARVATVGLLFHKSLRLSMDSLAEASIGHVVTLASSDVEKFQVSAVMGVYLVLAPLEALVVLAVGVYVVGEAFVAGFFLVLVLVPLQMGFSRRFGALRRELAAHTDRRVKLTAQAISGARLMKVMGWEPEMAAVIRRSREAELDGVRRSSSLRAANESIFFVAPLLQGYATFALHVALGREISPEMAVITLALLNVVALSFTKFFCLGVEFGAQSLVSTRRISRLLQLPEQSRLLKRSHAAADTSAGGPAAAAKVSASMRGGGGEAGDEAAKSGGGVLRVAGMHCKWSTAPTPTLSGVSLEVGAQEMLLLVGSVGAGKTSLLMALLGELPAFSAEGERLRPWEGAGRLAYAAQEPWILSATLRQNILLGAQLDEARYKAVLRATCLDAELARLPQRDLTEVGERGVALSGGQRARLGLARLAYRNDVDTYIIDDPLSALDPRVGRQVFERTLCGMLGGKRRILVTHQLQYLRDAAVDRVAVIAAGRLTACGSYDEVRASGALGSMKTDDATDGGRADADADADADPDASAAVPVPEPAAAVQGAGEVEAGGTQTAEATLAQDQVLEKSGDGAGEAGGEAQHGQDTAAGEPSVLIEAEERITGVVRIATYVGWARAASWPMLVLLMAMLLGAQLLSVLGSVFLPYWGTLTPEAQRRVLHGEGGEWSPLLLGMPWWALLPLTCGLTLLRSELHFRLAVRASRHIHEAALLRLLRAPVLFFDANPLGRILNRFSKDVEFCDSLLPATALDVLVCCLIVLASLCLCLAVTPWVAVLLLPLVIYFGRLRAFFLSASREIKRLDGLTRSPVFGAFAESLSGTSTIRAFDGMATLATARFHALHDANSRTYFQFVASARWLGLRLDVICSALLVFGTLATVAAKAIGGSTFGGGGNAGLLGASLIFLVRLAGLFQWTVRQTAELENQMVSVERLLSYAQLPQEPPLTSAAPPPAEWPQHGRLTLRDVSMRYRPGLAPALRGVSFEVAAGSLVGVCGRTGAGKSSLLAALFRLSEPHAGTVEIDGVDCGAIGLHELRPKLALIMQSPFLFAGTVADNLSPLGAHTDAQLWQALEHVQLKQLVASFDDGLQTAVADGGTSLSVGERQLLCLARALLQRARLLLLDEATANVDSATDATIQRSVRTHFHDSTVVMIAHRLLTIADVNQVLLLSEGRVFQSGPPAQLLREPPDEARVNFSAMVEDAGLAREAFAPSRQLQAAL